MKKIITIIMIMAMLVIMLTGCNMSIGLGNYSFKKIHVDTYNYDGCFTVENWHDDERGIEVKTKEAGSMYLAEGMYILIEDECPFCK